MSLLLMNSTYLSPQTLMTPITDMQPVYDRNDTYNASHLLRHEQKRKQQRQALQLLEEETDKKRRSLNIPEYGMPKEARLFNMKQNTLIQVHSDGRVSTTRNASSTLCIFEVLFWCHIAPHLYTPCSNRHPSTFSAVLLHFKESQRYLCMNKHGRIYTQSSRYSEECIFQHEFLTNNYDIYYSYKYPREADFCQGLKDSEKPPECSDRWHLSVSRNLKLRTLKLNQNRTSKGTFFILRWIYEHSGQSHSNYPKLTTSKVPSIDGGIFQVNNKRKKSDSPVFKILSMPRNSAKKRAGNSRKCTNLLKKGCEKPKPKKKSRKKSEEKPSKQNSDAKQMKRTNPFAAYN